MSLSYGKDSIACLEAIRQLGYPLDRIVHAEVWATDTIHADLPPMVEFKKKADKIILERYDIEVEHMCATRAVERERELPTNPSSISCVKPENTLGTSTDSPSPLGRGAMTDLKQIHGNKYEKKLTYEELFYHIPKRKKPSEREGERDGWQRHGSGCKANSQLKMAALRQINPRISNPKRELVQQQPQTCRSTDFQYQSAEGTGVRNSNRGFSSSPIAQGAKKNIVQYLGIAADEPERIKRHSVPGKVLPLVDIGWDEAYCRKWCEENDLLSPIYTTATRGGCWFCHNQGVDQLRLLRKDYPELWQLLLKWDLDSPTSFKSDGHTVHDFDKRFEAEDKGIIKAGDKRFRWKTVLEPNVNNN